MENQILEAADPGDAEREGALSVAERAVKRSLGRRRANYRDEVRRLIDASRRLMRDSERLDPHVGEIVRAAGLSNQAFYRHFESKDELFMAVLDEGTRELESYLSHRMETAASSLDSVRCWVEGILAQALDADAAAATRPFVRGRLAERFPEEVRASTERLTGLLSDALRRAQAEGDLCAVDAEREAEMIYDLAMGWMQRRLLSAATASKRDAQSVVEFALRGLMRANPATGRGK